MLPGPCEHIMSMLYMHTSPVQAHIICIAIILLATPRSNGSPVHGTPQAQPGPHLRFAPFFALALPLAFAFGVASAAECDHGGLKLALITGTIVGLGSIRML